MPLTEAEADQLLARFRGSWDEVDRLETLTMPNGLPIGACTDEYLRDLALELHAIGEQKRRRMSQLAIQIEQLRYVMRKKPGAL